MDLNECCKPSDRSCSPLCPSVLMLNSGQVPNLRVLVAGGDGTVGCHSSCCCIALICVRSGGFFHRSSKLSQLSVTDLQSLCCLSVAARSAVHRPQPRLGAGTGNDLARALNWGHGYAGGNLVPILSKVCANSCAA